MPLHSIKFIVGIITLIYAYLLSATLVGAAEAAVADWAGDDTPREEGFLSLNPVYYVDVVGFLCVIFIGLGWGKRVPFDPNNVKEPHKTWKVFLVYAAQPVFSLLLAFIALIINVFLFGLHSLNFAFFWSLSPQNTPFQQLATSYPNHSSIAIVFMVLLLSLIALNTFMATWSMINNTFHYILFIGAEHGHDYMKHAEALSFFGPLIVLLLFTGPLRFILLRIMISIAAFIGSCCGVVV